MRLVANILCLWLMLALIAPAMAQPGDAGEYRLGAGDLLKINIYGYPDMTADVRVDEAGSISYAYVGQVAVGGRSARDVESLVAEKLTQGGFIRSPQVSVLVSDYRSQKVAVMGQVGRPGQYPLRKASAVMDLLAEAGGVMNATCRRRGDAAARGWLQAKHRSVRVVRRRSGAEPAGGVGRHDLCPAMPRSSTCTAKCSGPARYKLERNMTVSQAISAGGGLTPRGTERRATVKRRNPQGKETKVSVKGSGPAAAG